MACAMLRMWLAAGLAAVGGGAKMSPPGIRWAKGYTFGAAESHPHAGVVAFDPSSGKPDGFFVVGDGVDYAKTHDVQRQVMLLRTDESGDERWNLTLGDQGYNYGKFALALDDGTFLAAGAVTVDGNPPLLTRAIARLSATGEVIGTLEIPNNGSANTLRDGFMGLAVGEKPDIVLATGFVGGENSTTGYPDEPMFLINGGHAFVTKLKIAPLTSDSRLTSDSSGESMYNKQQSSDTLQGGMEVVFDVQIPDDELSHRLMQGMRVLYDAEESAYLVSHTASNDNGNTLQMGLSSFQLNGAHSWTKVYSPEAPTHGVSDSKAYASHPYALAAGTSGLHALAGLAVFTNAEKKEQCEGRLLLVNASDGSVATDRRWRSKEPHANIECYGVANTPDQGWIISCGTGVEPELYPLDSKRAKTWRVLVHRTNADGTMEWDNIYTSNAQLQNNAGEFVVTLPTSSTDAAGGYAVLVDSQSYGSPDTGGNFAIMVLDPDATY